VTLRFYLVREPEYDSGDAPPTTCGVVLPLAVSDGDVDQPVGRREGLDRICVRCWPGSSEMATDKRQAKDRVGVSRTGSTLFGANCGVG